MAQKGKSTALKATLAVTVIIFASKALGFVREIVFAACFGTGTQMDAYNSAYSLYYVPVLLLNSCITATLVPLYIQHRHDKGPASADRFASNALNMFALISVVLSVLMMALAGPIVRMTYWGYDAETQRMIVNQLRIMLPSLMFLVSSIVLSSVLNAREQYLAAQLTGFPLNVALIFAATSLGSLLGSHALAWGVFAAGILQVVVLLPTLRGYKYSLIVRPKDKAFLRMLHLAVPAMLSMAVNELNHMIDCSLASSLPSGSLSGMNYGYKLIMFMTGVLVYPLTTVMFSKMSQRAADHDNRGVARLTMESLELLALVLLPITAVAAVLSTDVIRLAYQRGAFSDQSVVMTASSFLFYVVGVFFYGARDMLNRAFHAIQNTRITMINSAVTVAINIVLNLLLVRPMGVGGLALATSISALIGAGMLLWHLRRKLGSLGVHESLGEFLKIGVGTVCCAIVCLVLDRVVPQAHGTLMIFLRLALCAGVPLAAYLGIVMVLGAKQLSQLTRIVRRRLKRG